MAECIMETSHLQMSSTSSGKPFHLSEPQPTPLLKEVILHSLSTHRVCEDYTCRSLVSMPGKLERKAKYLPWMLQTFFALR